MALGLKPVDKSVKLSKAIKTISLMFLCQYPIVSCAATAHRDGKKGLKA